MIKNSKPLHPGIVLSEIYMKEMKLNQSQLAALIGTSAEMWVRMQAEYDLSIAREKAA
jgi:plasmid maintenance system antidote protein VapI